MRAARRVLWSRGTVRCSGASHHQLSFEVRTHRLGLAQEYTPSDGASEWHFCQDEAPSLTISRKLFLNTIMKVHLSHAATKYEIAYHTLISWVKGGKISSEKIQQGNRMIYQIEDSELVQFLETKKHRKHPKVAPPPVLAPPSQPPQVPDLTAVKEPTPVHHPPAETAPVVEPESPQSSTDVPVTKSNATAPPQQDLDSPPWDPEPTDREASAAKTPRRKNPVMMVKKSMRSLDLEQLCLVQLWIMNRISSKILTKPSAALHADVPGTP